MTSRSSTGRELQKWLLEEVRLIVSGYKGEAHVTEHKHEWSQNTIIARFPSEASIKGEGSDEVVIVGAHQNSTNMLPFLPASGADDDDSGTVTILEAMNISVQKRQVRKDHSVELHWYSGEKLCDSPFDSTHVTMQ